MAQNALEHYIEHVRPLFFNPKKADKAKNKVFLNQRGGALSRMSVWNIVQKAARDADITKSVYPHIFAIPSLLTCSKAAPIFAPCKKCLAIAPL